MDPVVVIASLIVASTPIVMAAIGELVVEKAGVSPEVNLRNPLCAGKEELMCHNPYAPSLSEGCYSSDVTM